MNTAFAISLQNGDPAPDFSLPSIDGQPVSLSDYKGSIVVLIYFRSDQKRSIMALHELKEIRRKYREKNLKFIGISAETEKRDSIIHEIKELDIDFPVLLDMERDVYGSYGIRVYPSTLVIDSKGNVADSLPGHALDYKIRIDGILQFVLGDIDESRMKKLISPEREVMDISALHAERRYNLALKFTEARLFDQAIELVKKSIEAKPDIAKSHILLGYLYLDAKETDKAVEQFENALKFDPSSHDAMTGLGSALTEQGDFDRAINVLNKALVQNPYPERTLYELGRAHELKGDTTNASAMYKNSIEKIMHDHVLPASVVHCK